ncbi:MAG: hypothetical protein AAGP08_03115 [Pseudomonadota bacterium]
MSDLAGSGALSGVRPLTPADTHIGQSGPRAQSTDVAALADAVKHADGSVNDYVMAGPPPTFDITVLELDRELMESVARMNAEQGYVAGRDRSDETPQGVNRDALDAAKAPAWAQDALPSQVATTGMGTPVSTVETPTVPGESA